MLENHYCDTASFFVAALRYGYRTAVLTALGAALSHGAKDSFPSLWKPRIFRMASRRSIHLCMAYMYGIALEQGRGSNQYITQFRILRVRFKYSSENAIEDGVCDPRLA